MKTTHSKHKNLKEQLQKAAKQAKGAYKTEHDRKLIIDRFNQYLKTHNIQIQHIDQIKTKYIESYIQDRLTQGISKRTLHNEMAALRQTLRAADRDKLADSERITNKALGLSGASRQGTKVAITENQYHNIHQQVLNKDPALAATLDIARTFGLRGEDAVQSCQSLKTWQNALNNGATSIKVVFCTKGGRPRQVHIINTQKALTVINNTLHITTQQNGKLINKPNLKQAMTYWRNQTKALGLTGKISPHSLRYAFAQDMTQYYIRQGYTEKEALALTSMDLGHGDGRGRFIKQIYNQALF